MALLFNSGSALLLEQTAIFYGLLNIVEGTDSTPSGPRFYISTLAVLLGCLTLAVMVLGVLTSRRWASSHTTPSLGRTILRLIPSVGVLALGVAYPKIAGHLVGGRDVSWLAAAYGWPALVAFALGAMIASALCLIATVWQLTGPPSGASRAGGPAMSGFRRNDPSHTWPIRRATIIRQPHAGAPDQHAP